MKPVLPGQLRWHFLQIKPKNGFDFYMTLNTEGTFLEILRIESYLEGTTLHHESSKNDFLLSEPEEWL